MWRQARHPETALRIARLQNELGQLERIGPMLTKWSEGLVEEPTPQAVAMAEASAAKARAASGH